MLVLGITTYLALRLFGGSCEGDLGKEQNRNPEVKFATNNVNQKLRAMQVEPRGKTTLADAITRVAGDFNDVARFPNHVNKKVLVVTGSSDPCVKDTADFIRE